MIFVSYNLYSIDVGNFFDGLTCMNLMFDLYQGHMIKNNFFSCTSFSPDFLRNRYVGIHKTWQALPNVA